jgi:hypothetical protein
MADGGRACAWEPPAVSRTLRRYLPPVGGTRHPLRWLAALLAIDCHNSDEEASVAEQMILVCDVCDEPAVQTVKIAIARQNLLKDLCATHLAELTTGARRPKRGRRAVAAVPAEPTSGRRGRPARKTTQPATRGAKQRRGRPRKVARP